MPKTKTKKRGTRRMKKTRRVMPRRKKTTRGGYDPASNDNSFYPTKMNGYPTMSNYALPDPKYIDHVTVDR
jgi:hypothetical protein